MLGRVILAALAAASILIAGPSTTRLADWPKDGQVSRVTSSLAMGDYCRFTCTWKSEGDTTIPVFTCERQCQGKKHKKHDECDLSCDNECPKKGYATTAGAPEVKPHGAGIGTSVSDLALDGDGAPAKKNAKTLDDDFTKFQLPQTCTGEDALKRLFDSSPMSADFAGLKLPNDAWMSFYSDHWNKTPCSSSTKYIAGKKYSVTVEYDIWDIEKSDGKEIKTQGPKGKLRFLVIFPVKGDPTPGDPVINCRCEVKQEPPKEKQPTGGPGGYVPGKNPKDGGEYAWVEEGGEKHPVTSTDIGNYISTITVPDMNEALIEFPPMVTGSIYIPAGWELENQDGDGQDVQLCESLFGPITGTNVLRVSIRPVSENSKSLRTLCLQIDKHEPSAGMKYKLMPPRNPGLIKLAQMTNASRIKGPWDQVRLWIATDYASYDKMSKILIPMPGQGTYLKQMYLCAQAGAIAPSDNRVLQIMEARFLFASGGDLDATKWMLAEKLRADQGAFCKQVMSQRSAIEALFGKDPKEATSVCSAVCGGLAREGGAASVTCGIWLLTQAVPEAQRTAAANTPGGQELALVLRSTKDEKSASAIFDWLEKDKPPYTAFACSEVNQGLSEAIKQRAKKLMDSVGHLALGNRH